MSVFRKLSAILTQEGKTQRQVKASRARTIPKHASSDFYIARAEAKRARRAARNLRVKI